MGFRREMHDRIRLMGCERGAYSGMIGNIGLDEGVAIAGSRLLERIQRRGIRHLVDIDDAVIGVSEKVADNGRADESAAACDKHAHCQYRSLNRTGAT